VRRRLDRFRLVSPTGAPVVSVRRLTARERVRVTAPSLFTTANICCGFGSVLVAFRGEFTLAAALIAVSIVLDVLDGAVARAVGATSPFGVQLDSMADLISFGVAPAVLVHTWVLGDSPALGWVFAFLWLTCAAFRLARFNVTVDPLADKRYFVGLPSPGAAGVPVATVFALDDVAVGPWIWLPLAVAVVPAVLMTTSVRFRSFRSLLSVTHLPRLQVLVVLALLVAGLVVNPALTGLCAAYGYVLTAPLGWLTRPVRRRLFGADAVAPPRTRQPSVFLSALADETDPPEVRTA
jgi:CDP-diacylglycerol--serine O-phosphatidyltransferase